MEYVSEQEHIVCAESNYQFTDTNMKITGFVKGGILFYLIQLLSKPKLNINSTTIQRKLGLT